VTELLESGPARGTAPSVRWSTDRCTIHQGDALAVLASLPSDSVDALITDPPYSSGGMVRGDRMGSTTGKYVTTGRAVADVPFAGDTRDQRAYGYWCALWLSEALRVVRPSGLAILFTDWRQLPTTTDALQAGGWVWRGIVPWVKPAGTYRPQAGRFAAQCEYVVWGSRGELPVRMGIDPTFSGFFHGRTPRDREHIAQKPLDVMLELIRIVPPGGTVLDLFMGSGTTGVAAVAEGRRFVGVEVVDHYAATAERRIRAAMGDAVPGPDGQTALLLDDGDPG